MTCIIGLEHEGRVYIGGDSQATAGWQKQTIAGKKIFRRKERWGGITCDLLFGCAGSPRMAQLLQNQVEIPTAPLGGVPDGYVVIDLMDAVRACFKAGGYITTTEGQEKGGTFLLGYRGCLFQVGSDFQAERYASGMAAIGVGDAYALGAMMALKRMSPEKRILKALQIAGELCMAVSGPYYVEVLE